MTEGGPAELVTIDILNPAPGAITISLVADSQCEVRPLAAGGFSSSVSYLIPPAPLPISIEVRAVDDTTVEGPHSCTIVTNPVSGSTNPLVGYNPPDLVFNITDDEPFPQLTISPTTLNATEGETVSFDVTVENLEAGANLSINISAGSQCLIAPAPAVPSALGSTVFVSADVTRTYNVQPIDDPDVEGPHSCTFSTVIGGSGSLLVGFNAPDITVNITDNEPLPTLTITPTTLNATEGETVSFDVTVDNLESGANLSINISAGSQCLIAPAPAVPFAFGSTVFVSADVTRTYNVQPIDDPDVEGPHSCTFSTVIGGSGSLLVGFNAPDVTVNITDNDTPPPGPGIGITGPAGTVDEATPTTPTTITVVLNAAPNAGETVTVTLTPDAQVTLDLTVLTFTDGTWAVPQTVQIFAVNDAAIEANPHPATITVTVGTTGGAYDGITTAPDVTVQVIDDDTTLPPVLPAPAFYGNNIGLVMIPWSMRQPAYAAPNGPIAADAAGPIFLPHDADGNGFDTYLVNDLPVWTARFG